MGSLTSALGPIFQAGSALGTVAGVVRPFVKNAQSENQLQAKNEQEQKALAQNIALQKEQNQLASAQAEEMRQSALKRAIARQKAIFGARGSGDPSGSSEAVLLGQFQESEAERVARQRSDALRDKALDQSFNQKRQSNLLEQEQQRQKNLLTSLSDLL